MSLSQNLQAALEALRDAETRRELSEAVRVLSPRERAILARDIRAQDKRIAQLAKNWENGDMVSVHF
jgi:hypothetical protein